MRMGMPVVLVALLGPGVVHASEGIKINTLRGIYHDAREGNLKAPEGVASDGSSLLAVADTGNGRVLVYTFESGQVKPMREIRLPQIGYPVQVQFAPGGDLLVLDGRSRKIVRVSATGEFKAEVEPRGDTTGGAPVIKSFKVGPAGDLYLLDVAAGRVLVLAEDGTVKRSVALPGDARSPGDIAVDAGGTVYAIETVGRRVDVAKPGDATFSPQGGSLRDDAEFPTSIAVDAQGIVCVGDRLGHGLIFLESNGSFRGRQSAMGWKEGLLRYPSGLAFAPAGVLVVADRGNNRVQIFRVTE